MKKNSIPYGATPNDTDGCASAGALSLAIAGSAITNLMGDAERPATIPVFGNSADAHIDAAMKNHP